MSYQIPAHATVTESNGAFSFVGAYSLSQIPRGLCIRRFFHSILLYLAKLFRCQNHDQGSTLKFRMLLDRSRFFGFHSDFFEQGHPQFGQRDFATSEYHGNLDFVFSVDELFYMADLGLQIMRTSFRAHLYFLDLKGALFLFGFLFLFGLFIPVAPIVHDFTYRRTGIGRDFNQVETKFSRRFKRLSGRNYSDLIAVGVYNPDFFSSNRLIDVNFV